MKKLIKSKKIMQISEILELKTKKNNLVISIKSNKAEILKNKMVGIIKKFKISWEHFDSKFQIFFSHSYLWMFHSLKSNL